MRFVLINLTVERPKLSRRDLQADELLHTASCGDKAAHSKIIQLLREVQAQGIKDRARKEWFPDPPPQPKLRRPEPYPDATPMLEQRPRPKAEIVGIRHVPKLTGANAIPFLRFKKPQSPFLTRVLNDKAQQRQKRRDAVDEMEDLISFGWAEQEWDVKTGMTDETKWHMATELESTRVAQQLLTADRANGVLAKRMLAVVDEEQRLADLEKRARMKDKRRARRRSKGKGGDHEEGLLSSEGDQEGHVESQPHGESPVFKVTRVGSLPRVTD